MTQKVAIVSELVHRIAGDHMDSVPDLVLSVPINCVEQISRDHDRFNDIVELEASIDKYIAKLMIPSEDIPDSTKFIGLVSLLRNNLPEYRERIIERGVAYVESKWEDAKQWYDSKEDLLAATSYASAIQLLERKVHLLGHIVSKLKEEGFRHVWLNWVNLSRPGRPIRIPGSDSAFICPVCRTIGDQATIAACKHIVACPSCAFLHPKGGECVSLADYHGKMRKKFLAERAASTSESDSNTKH